MLRPQTGLTPEGPATPLPSKQAGPSNCEEPTMTTAASTSSPRLRLDIDVTELSDDQRRRFTEAVTDLLDEYRSCDEDAEPAVSGWTPRTLNEALTRLDRDGGWVQARAIRQALENGGVVSRAEIYEIGKYKADRMLRGFTRPAKRIVDRMRANGEVPGTALYLLDAVYNHGVMADEFRVPAELADLLD